MKDLLTILKLKLLFGDVPPSIRDDSFDIVDIGSVLPEEIQQRIPKIILEKKINNQALAIILEFYSKNRKPINNGLITTVGALLTKYSLPLDDIGDYLQFYSPPDPLLVESILKELKKIRD